MSKEQDYKAVSAHLTVNLIRAMMAAEEFTRAIRQLQEQAGQPSEHLAEISQGILDLASDRGEDDGLESSNQQRYRAYAEQNKHDQPSPGAQRSALVPYVKHRNNFQNCDECGDILHQLSE